MKRLLALYFLLNSCFCLAMDKAGGAIPRLEGKFQGYSGDRWNTLDESVDGPHTIEICLAKSGKMARDLIERGFHAVPVSDESIREGRYAFLGADWGIYQHWLHKKGQYRGIIAVRPAHQSQVIARFLSQQKVPSGDKLAQSVERSEAVIKSADEVDFSKDIDEVINASVEDLEARWPAMTKEEVERVFAKNDVVGQ